MTINNENIEILRIESYTSDSFIFPVKNCFLLCEVKEGLGELKNENQLNITDQDIILLDLKKENKLFSKNGEPLSFLTIEFFISDISISSIMNKLFRFDELQIMLLEYLQIEVNKKLLIQRSKPSLTHDKDIATYFTICQKNSQHLLKQLLLSILEKECFKALPSDYQTNISQLSKDNTLYIKNSLYPKKAQVHYPNQLINEVISYMNEHLEENLTIEYLAQHFYTSSANLKKQFKKNTNKSIISYFKDLKMNTAQQWIRENEISYTEIAERLGFNSIHHFSAAFKKHSGYSPSNYYKSLQPGYVDPVNKMEVYLNHPRMM